MLRSVWVSFMPWGEGVEQDYKKASSWYRLAAEQGYSRAQYALGRHYDLGLGVVQDKAEAARWYLLAALTGDQEARYDIGMFYYKGIGVPQDKEEAYFWWYLYDFYKSEFDDPHEDNLAAVAAELSAGQRGKIVARAEAWLDENGW